MRSVDNFMTYYCVWRSRRVAGAPHSDYMPLASIPRREADGLDLDRLDGASRMHGIGHAPRTYVFHLQPLTLLPSSFYDLLNVSYKINKNKLCVSE